MAQIFDGYAASAKTPPELAAMLREFNQADTLFKPSPFWEKLALQHFDELEKFGFGNFKRTVSLRYFTWGILEILARQAHPLVWSWLKRPDFKVFLAKSVADQPGAVVPGFKWPASKIYAMFVALLVREVGKTDHRGLLRRIKEPVLGAPLLVDVGGGLTVSQDICNSVHEYLRSTSALPDDDRPIHVLEIGAGYGRLLPVFAAARPGSKYWIVDIPPALYVSQRYVSELFPDKKTFKFRHFDRFEDVRAEVAAADFCFFQANQIGMLPAQSVDVTVCISNLHEMTLDQIRHYYDEIGRLTRGYFYTKQWIRSHMKENGFTIRREEYPAKPGWQPVFNRQHDIQSWFFEALYKVGADKPS